jgi:nucleotide-binding universal stress UspA family protein
MTDAYHVTRILVPVDGSEFSRYAAEHAVRLAHALGPALAPTQPQLIFLHVVDSQVVEQLAQQGGSGEREVRERLVEQGRIYLQDVARLAEEEHVPHREEVQEGDPCAVICDTATAVDANLIVMGKIGRRGARRIIVGSITRRVIECCDQAVLVISRPPPK